MCARGFGGARGPYGVGLRSERQGAATASVWDRGPVALGSSPAAWSPVILCPGWGQGDWSPRLPRGPAPCSPRNCPLKQQAGSVLVPDHLARLAVPPNVPPHPGNIRPAPGKYLLADTPSPCLGSQPPKIPGGRVGLTSGPPPSRAGPGQRGVCSPPPLTRPSLSAKQEAVITGGV